MMVHMNWCEKNWKKKKGKKTNSPGPGSGRYAVKKTFFDIINHLVLVLVHLFPEYFDFLLLRSVCGSV